MVKLYLLILSLFMASCQDATFLADERFSAGNSTKNSCDDLGEGESESVIFYENDLISFGDSCENHEVELEKKCSNGRIIYKRFGETIDLGDLKNSCSVQSPEDCGDLLHGESESREMFRSSSVGFGEQCQKELQKRECYNGELSDYSGSYIHDSCLVSPPRDCGEVAHGSSESRIRYESLSVEFGEKCQSEKQERSCYNGLLSKFSGSFSHDTCKVEGPKSCGDLASGDSEQRLRYQSSKVEYGKKCISEKQSRTCKNGVLSNFSGSFIHESCEVSSPKDCESLAHGQIEKRLMYKSDIASSDMPCESEVQIRHCDNGRLSDFSGSFSHKSCEVKMKDCKGLAHGEVQSRVRFLESLVAFGGECKKEEQIQKCDDGVLSDYSGSFSHEACKVEDPKSCGELDHLEKISRVRFESEKAKECKSELQVAECSNGILSDFSGSFKHDKCEEDSREPAGCKSGKVLVVSVDKNGDGIADTKPMEIVAYKGDYTAKQNYNYYSASAHTRIGPKPEGYAANVFFYEGKDGLSLQFVYSKDREKGDTNYNGSPNSKVRWDFYTEGNDLKDKVMVSDDGKEFKLVSKYGQTHKYVGNFHYWYNTDGGALGPFVTRDFRIKIKPIHEYEIQVKKKNGKVISRKYVKKAINSANFYSADGAKKPLNYEPGKDHIIIEFKEEKVCEQPVEKIGCSDGSREGFKDLNRFSNIAACAGGFQEKGVLPEHRVRKCDQAGNDSSNPEGEGCSVQDVCAKGWEVLPSLSVLQEFTHGDYCHSMEEDELTKNIAFVGGVTGPGWGKIYSDDEQLHAILNYKDYNSREYNKHVNDLFYCGGKSVAYHYGNHPYKKFFSSFSNNQCYGARSFAQCQSKGGHLEAIEYIQKLHKSEDQLKGGGVICVKSKAVDELEIDERLRRVVEEEVDENQCDNLLQNGSFETGHGLISKRGWTIYNSIGPWHSDKKYSNAGIEIQCHGVAGFKSSDGNCHVELDAHNHRGYSESDVAMNQVLNLKKGEYYSLSFDYFPRSSNAKSNQFQIYMEDMHGNLRLKLGDHILGGEKKWHKKEIKFKSYFDGPRRIFFRASKDSDTIGINIDNIQVLNNQCSE